MGPLLRIVPKVAWIHEKFHNLLCLGTVHKAEQSLNFPSYSQLSSASKESTVTVDVCSLSLES